MSRRGLTFVATLSLLAAIGYVVGPVTQDAHEFSFKPSTVAASGESGDPVVAPLPLLRDTPDRVELAVACEQLGTQFRSITLGHWAGGPLLFPELGLDLQVLVGEETTVSLGGREILRGPVEAAPGCVVTVVYDDGSWSLDTGSGEWSTDDSGPRFAEALFVGSSSVHPDTRIEVVTRELGTSPSVIQLIFFAVALGGVLVVGRAILVGGVLGIAERKSIRWRLDRIDWTVLSVLVGWLIFLPPFTDDGWSAAIQAGYPQHGDISGINQAGGAPWALGYWLEWARHWWLRVSSNPAVVRLPTIVIGLGTWLGMRSILRLLDTKSRTALWTMAAAFVVGFGSWGVTTRPEPIIAALAVGSLYCALRFVESPDGPVVLAWVTVVALSVSAHPIGLVAIGPVLVALPRIWRWLRSDRQILLGGVAAVLMLATMTILLAFLDSNLASKLAASEEWRQAGHGYSILDEVTRYELLGEAPFGTTMRRLSVAYLLIPIGVLVLYRRRGNAQDVAAWSILWGLLLLTPTPSKWPLHLGALLGVGAVGLAIAADRVRGHRSSTASLWSKEGVRVLAAIVGSLGLLTFALSIGTRWNAFDLRTADWWAGLSLRSMVTLAGVAIVGVLLLLAARRGWPPLGFLVWGSAILAIALMVITPAVDALRTDGWTWTRQSLRSTFGGSTCGLGDEVRVPAPGSMRALAVAPDQVSVQLDAAAQELGFEADGPFAADGFAPHSPSQFRPSGINSVLPAPGVTAVGSWAEGTEGRDTGSFRSDWYEVDLPAVAFMVHGSIGEDHSNRVAVQWRSGADGTTTGGVESTDLSGRFPDWVVVWFDVPDGMDRVRVLIDDSSVDSWLAATSPLGFDPWPIADLPAGVQQGILVGAPLSFYFPCLPYAGYQGAVVDPPGVVVQSWGEAWQTTFAPAIATDRYFRWPVHLTPPLPAEQVGAHAGDPSNLVFVSQEYLTGMPARSNGSFVGDQ